MIRAIVTDIERTTSSLSFVKDVLFPYSRERMANFVIKHGADPTVGKLLDDARKAADKNLDEGEVIRQLVRWIDEDKKITSLKALQGMIWEDGYKQGHFKGHIYDDAVRHLKEWKEQGIRLYVSSSGSVQAQKLLSGHTEYGDLTPLFSGYFDTATSAKKDPAAYRAIAKTIGLSPGEILHLSDIKTELDAAREAGMETVWVVRDSVVDAGAEHTQAGDFSMIGV